MRRSNYNHHHGIPVSGAFIPADVTWVYGSTEENRQKYINELIDENMKEYVGHIDELIESINNPDSW